MAAPSLSRTMTVCFSRHTQPFESAGQSRVRSQEAREAHSDGSPARVTSEMQAVQAFDASDTPSLLVLGDTGSSTPVGGRQSVSAWVFGTVLRSVVQRRSVGLLRRLGRTLGRTHSPRGVEHAVGLSRLSSKRSRAGGTNHAPMSTSKRRNRQVWETLRRMRSTFAKYRRNLRNHV